MPYIPHYKVTMHGTLGGELSREEWSTGFAIGGAGTVEVAGPIDPQAAVNIVDLIVALVENPDTLISNQATLTDIKFSLIGANGRVVVDEGTGSFVQTVFTDFDNTGNVSANRHPFQVANVVSLLTTRTSKSGRGRMYLPTPAAAVDINGRISAGQAQACADAMASFFAAVTANVATDLQSVVVASQKGYNSPVTAVRVGQVLDTHRSRRRSLEEDYALADM